MDVFRFGFRYWKRNLFWDIMNKVLSMDAAARRQVSVSADFAFHPSAQEVWIRVEDIDHPDVDEKALP
ncbi:MAG: hypothetical protein II800_07765 [Lachnospiraceae bacterium]|nr:hypothetical protein [Lachnospiraceae bacterium]